MRIATHGPVLGLVSLLLGLSPPALAFELCPGVVVDPAAAKLYMMNERGGIDSVSVASGELLWSSTAAAKPLAVYGEMLVAQAENATVNRLEIVLLDALSGDRSLAFPVDLPAGVYGAIDEGMGTSLNVRAVIHEGEPWISWEATERYVQGVAPSPDEALESRQGAVLRLDQQTQRAVAADDDPFSQGSSDLPPQVQAWVASSGATSEVLAVGDLFAATQADRTSGRERFVLQRWNADGVPLPEVVLFSRPHVVEFPSADGRHLLIAERAAPGEFTEYEWFIFSLETGERLGQVSHHQSHGRFFVSGNAVTYLERPYGRLIDGRWVDEPRKLRTVLLGSAALVWQRPLRDTTFKGEFPP